MNPADVGRRVAPGRTGFASKRFQYLAGPLLDDRSEGGLRAQSRRSTASPGRP